MPDEHRHQGLRLTAPGVRQLRHPGKYHDGSGHGLYLVVSPSGTKRWEQRVTTFGGRRRTLGHGRYPDVSLREARERALRVRALVADGVDPLVHRRTPAVPTFAEAVEQVIRGRRSDWTSPTMEGQWRRMFERHVYPHLGTFRVSDIETFHIVAVLQALQERLPKSVSRVRHCIGVVTAWAVGQGYRTHDPCGRALAQVMPLRPPKTQSHRSLPYDQVPAALDAVRASDAWIGTRLLMEFLALNGCAHQRSSARSVVGNRFRTGPMDHPR